MIARFLKFKDMFKDHVAILDEHHNTQWDCIIEFRNQKGSEDWFRFIYLNGYLTIQSDYGHSIFTWGNPKNSMSWMAGLKNEGYILEKCVASSIIECGSNFKHYDESLALTEYNDWIINFKEEWKENEDHDTIVNLNFPKLNFESYDRMKESVYVKLYNYLYNNDLCYDELHEFGIGIHRRFYVQWAALYYACEKLWSKTEGDSNDNAN